MTARIEKTIFISYRRTNLPWALAIYQELMHHGYDVFFDYLSIPSGDFENIIVENIKARAHFVVILTPSALERCNEPGGWLRREIETAMDEKRNIIPLMLESFDFGSPSTVSTLTGKLEKLKKYNGLRVYSEYFFESMDRLRKQYLNVSLDTITHLISEETKPIVAEHQVAASEAKPIEKEELTAQEWAERGYTFAENKNFDEAIRCYTEAIRLEPELALAYNNRGNIYGRDKGDMKSAIKDFDEAIRLKPDYAAAYNNRGNARSDNNDLQGALADYDEVIRLEPNNAAAYNNRGNARSDNNDLQGALADYDEAIHLRPDYAAAYNNRGILYREQGELDDALADYTEAIRFEPDFISAYYHRAETLEQKTNYSEAIADYQKYLELGGGKEYNNQKEVENKIKKLKSKLAKKKSVSKKTK